jgi:hypothetical protein
MAPAASASSAASAATAAAPPAAAPPAATARPKRVRGRGGSGREQGCLVLPTLAACYRRVPSSARTRPLCTP